MNEQDLKNSILQLAIQGKLVEQREEEGTSEELLKRLKGSKDYLVREKKIYSKKETEPFYKNEDLPLDIPDTWRWVKLSDISIIQEGAGIRKYQYRDAGVQVFSVTNILEGSVDLEKKQIYVSCEEFQEKYTHLQLNEGDIVTACSGGSWGKVAIYDKEDIVMLNTSTLRLRFFEDIGNNSFLYYISQSAFFKQQLQEQLVGMQPNFGYAHYSRICLPLPPLEEQKRIVAKIEELMPYAEKYGEAYSKVEGLNKKFPEDMQKSILQYAIQGKLVEQREEEGNAEELYQQIQEEKKNLIKEGKIKKTKAFPGITEDEIPFDIPKNWKWVRLNDILNFIDYRGKTPNKINSGVVLITASNIRKGFLDFSKKDFISKTEYYERMSRGTTQKGDILFTTEAPLGNVAINTLEISNGGQRVITFQQYGKKYFHNELICFFIQSPLFQQELLNKATGTTAKGIKAAKLKNVLVPLPPLEEQSRIVAKIEEMLPYCQQLVR